MFELADMKTVRRRLREQLFKARKLLKKAEARVKTGPAAFRAYAGEVIEYQERVRVLEEVFKASSSKGVTPGSLFDFAFMRVVCGCESRSPDIPTNHAWALVAQLLKKNSVYA